MIVMDMFFPSTHLGWEKTNVLCCADAWSRYTGVYVIDTKRKADVLKAMTDFLKAFAAMGHLPRFGHGERHPGDRDLSAAKGWR